MTKRRAVSSLKNASVSEEVNAIREVNVEVESRTFSSAAVKGGKECYRCLTTVCQLWHSYGKLQLIMCNACVVNLDNTACGYCGNATCKEGDRISFSCRLCSRGTHEQCEQVKSGICKRASAVSPVTLN